MLHGLTVNSKSLLLKRIVKISVFILSGIVLCSVIAFFLIPSNSYVKKALIHQIPKIDQYPIFENRIIKAGNPKLWEYSGYYNTLSIPEKYEQGFKEYETVAYVIIRDGKILYEQYWDDYSAKSLSNSFSMAKSIVSLAIGCAIDDGFIRNTDQPVSDFFPQYKGFNGKTLTIRHLLTMSAGFDFEEAYSSLFSPTNQLYYGDNLLNITFGMKEVETPGDNFIYQSGVTQLLAFIIEKATGENLSSYVSRKIWIPVEAEEDALWSLDKKDGFEKAYCCFNSNARDFARLGQLVLNKGKWGNKQIISYDYIKEAVTPDESLIFKKHEIPNKQYGFQYWILEKNGMTIPYMRGMLGQYVFIIPERNAVVVRLGKKQSQKNVDKQFYPKDIDIWLDAAFEMLDNAPKKARLIFGGDLMQHLPQVNASKAADGKNDYTEAFKYVKPIFEQADLAFVNLETTLNKSNYYTGFPLFRSPEELAAGIKENGIDVTVLANNHALDNGARGVEMTQELLDSAGVLYSGVYCNTEQYINNHPLNLKVNGFNIALLNYTYGTNGLPVPPGFYINKIDSFLIARDLSLINRNTTDIIIVFFHWGYEYAKQPNKEQIALAELCHRYGAEIVIGSHPHVIQPIDTNEKTFKDIKYTDNVTVYSLGNLVSSQRERFKNGGLIVTLDLTKEKDKPLNIETYYTPVWIQTPKYQMLTPSVADTIYMTDKDRNSYTQFINDTKKLLSGNNKILQSN
jgi:CubicO group peptidase (beta-lactamase class C family)